MAEGTLSVRVVSPERVVYEGDATALVAPAWDGEVGILPGHAPLLTLVGVGELRIQRPEGGREIFHVAGGVLKVMGDQTTVLAEHAGTEPASEALRNLAQVEDVVGTGRESPPS